MSAGPNIKQPGVPACVYKALAAEIEDLRWIEAKVKSGADTASVLLMVQTIIAMKINALCRATKEAI